MFFFHNNLNGLGFFLTTPAETVPSPILSLWDLFLLAITAFSFWLSAQFLHKRHL